MSSQSQQLLLENCLFVVTGQGCRDAFGDVDCLEFPENNLHAMEQIRRGEEIVLAFKQDQKMTVVKTFSCDLAQAINLYAKKYGVRKKVYGIVVNAKGKMKRCHMSFDPIFEDMVPAFDMLMALRSQLRK